MEIFVPDSLVHQKAANRLRRWLPLAALLALIGLAFALGLHKYFTLQTIADNRVALESFVAGNMALALLLYVLVYVTIVALSLPGAAILSIFGGFVFGWLLGAPTTVIAATIGSTIVFQVVKTSLGAALAERAGPFVQKLSRGFAEDSFHYLLFLRLVPAFPFFAVNTVAGLARVELKTFVAATFIGIIPGTIAFSFVGSGLDSVIDAQMAANKTCLEQAHAAGGCDFDFSFASLITPELLAAFAALGVVAIIPVILKKIRARP
jgi:uncharacterized membrane protein YdjX (TVP38/TMEM64 family)